ncbi:DNA sulfur modification protein DndB [Streptomyces sp. NPDC040724]|uniref:DNA sulfur modification protein DndB n=1 Tax=Streptomyces sp. NPDC040724 TaxID=3155612 RepID=UPI0033F602E5
MSITTFSGTQGIQIPVHVVRDGVAYGTLALRTLMQYLPDPAQEEDPKKLAMSSAHLRRHAELRSLVQRTVSKASNKGKNVPKYAEYITDGLKGEMGAAWSIPAITLWAPDEDGEPTVTISDEPVIPGTNVHAATLPTGIILISIDGETQSTSWHRIYSFPEEYGLTLKEIRDVVVPVELYYKATINDARQIFHDRNLKGVTMDKNLAMSMDQRDYATKLAHRIADTLTVQTVDGKWVELSALVEKNKRQLSVAGGKIITLSGLRSMVVTTLLGKSGIASTSGTVMESDLNEKVPAEQQEDKVLELVTRALKMMMPALLGGAKQTAANAPAVLAGVGVALHHGTGWAETNALSDHQIFGELLSGIQWERSARFWDGVGGKASPTLSDPLAVSFAGGIKDSAGRVAEAVLNPYTEAGKKIRGL